MANSNKTFKVGKVAILGSGVMGAQIAAHFANANIPAMLFDLAKTKDNPNELSHSAIERLKKLKPAPLGDLSSLEALTAANYEEHLPLLATCDLIVESISERLDWKLDLYKKISPYIGQNTIVASNTSGLSINKLANALPETIRPNFLGVHFFNPPRYMNLVELIPHKTTAPEVMQQVEAFVVSYLGKGAVWGKDTPNFIGNRIGMFSILSILHHAEKMQIRPDVVDLLTGTMVGRPKSATCRTLDIVGLDTYAHIIDTMQQDLKDDPWHKFYLVPDWIKQLISKGLLGQKTKDGIYKKVGEEMQIFDPVSNQYVPAISELSPEIVTILKNKDLNAKFQALRSSQLKEAQFLWACFRDLFHYSSYHLTSIADTCRDVDLAMRWGYAWSQGPFETWQAIGWDTVTNWLEEDFKAQKTMSNATLPNWLSQLGKAGVYTNNASFCPEIGKHKARSDLSVYERQTYKDPMIGETFPTGNTLYESDAVRLFTLSGQVGIISFKTKMNTVTTPVLLGIQAAMDAAKKHNMQGVVLWNNGSHFSLGANLQDMLDAMANNKPDDVELMLQQFQKTSQLLRYSTLPTVAAVKGMVLGGGCELALHCDRIVAAFETNIGLVETGVGLIPAGGGCKEISLRLSRCLNADTLMPTLEFYFNLMHNAWRSSSARDAQNNGFLKAADPVIMNPYEILYVAENEALSLAKSCYQPPIARKITVAGTLGIETIGAKLDEKQKQGQISEHDVFIGKKLAFVLSGGNVPPKSQVTESHLLDLERKCFMELLSSAKSQERIKHTLKTGKPLKN